MNEKPIIIKRHYAAPIEKVWAALTEKDQMKEWYFDLKAFRPEVGFRFQFTGTSHSGKTYLHLCEVTEVVPLQKITYSWRYDGYPGLSYVTFELKKEDKGTHLTLTHAGVDSFPEDNPDLVRENFVEGWTAFVEESLQAYLSK